MGRGPPVKVKSTHRPKRPATVRTTTATERSTNSMNVSAGLHNKRNPATQVPKAHNHKAPVHREHRAVRPTELGALALDSSSHKPKSVTSRMTTVTDKSTTHQAALSTALHEAATPARVDVHCKMESTHVWELAKPGHNSVSTVTGAPAKARASHKLKNATGKMMTVTA
tara:strand:+ start:779 stop:1285 length:507 start_codon:yes stop_codon:yes gene_type:complete